MTQAPHRIAAALPAALLCGALLLSCSGESLPATDRDALRPVPAPDLVAAEDAVREQLGQARQNLDTRLADPATPDVDLATSFGELGLLYLVYDFLDPAEICFENAQTLQPAAGRWPYLRGYLRKIQGDLERAVPLLEAARALDPDFAPAALRLARAKLERGDLDAAATLFEQALEKDADSAAAHEGLGKVASARGETAAAAKHFERALELMPDASSLHYALGQAYRKLGDMERAAFHLERRGDAPVRIPDAVINPLADLGRSAQFYLLRGGSAMEDEDYALAEGAYARAVELDPKNFLAYRGRSFAAEKLGDLDGAVAHLEAALANGRGEDTSREAADRAEILQRLGVLEVRRGHDAAGAGSFAGALELAPDNHGVRLLLANALARLGRFEDALVHFDLLLEQVEPPSADLHLKRAAVLVNLDRHADALRAFERAVALAPDDPRVRLRYAEALERFGDTAKAAAQRAAAGASATGDPERLALLVERGRREVGENRFEAAVTTFREALEIAPTQTGVRFQLASVLAHLGRFAEALPELRRVVEEAPQNAAARRAEILALLLSSRYGDARVRLQDALKTFPQDRDLALAQIHLLTTAPDARVRDGKLAVQIAERVAAMVVNVRVVEASALAYAEAGDLDKAKQLQRRLIEDAREAGIDPARVAALARRLESFEAGRGWHAADGAEVVAGAFGE